MQSAWKVEIALILTKKVIVLVKYTNIANVFSKKLAKKMSKQTSINEQTIELQEDKQPFYESIYSLGLVKLKIFKIYIKTNLANDII